MVLMSANSPAALLAPGHRFEVAAWARRWSGRAFWVPPVLLTAAVVCCGSTRPQLWRDEFATWSAAHRPLADLLRLTGHVDGVLEPYYLLMHWWLRLAGDSVPALRLPSMVAIAATSGMVAAVGAVLGSRRAGLLGGLVYAVVPSTSRYGQEARPYAPAALAATAATLLLLLALRDGRRRLWSAYAVAIAAVGALHLVALLLLAGHVVVLLDEARAARSVRVLLRPGCALLAGVAPLVPLAVRGHDQAARELGHRVLPTTVHTLAVLPASLAGGILAGVALVILAVAGSVRSGRSAARFGWLTLAPLVMFAVVGRFSPLLNPRYALFVVPLACVLAGLALARLHPSLAIVIVLVTALGSLPDQAVVRRSHESRGDPLIDYRAAARIIRDHRQPGDGIIYRRDGWQFSDIGLEYYLRGDLPADVLAARDRDAAGSYWTPEVSDPGAMLAGCDRVWVVTPAALTKPFDPQRLPAPTRNALDLGHVLVRQWHVAGFAVSLYRRRPS
jgi:mannosyltransferase